MEQDITRFDRQAVKAEIHEILTGLARTRQTISYSRLAMLLQSATLHHRAPVFHHLLREICREEIQLGRPVLGVLVVNKQTGICGAGFFKFCASIGHDVSDAEQFWQSEFNRVCNYWDDAGGHDDDNT